MFVLENDVNTHAYCGPFLQIVWEEGHFVFDICGKRAESLTAVAAAMLAQGRTERVLTALKGWMEGRRKLNATPLDMRKWDPSEGAWEELEKRLMSLRLAPTSMSSEEHDVVRELVSIGFWDESFQTIQDALEAADKMQPTADKPVAVVVSPGIYHEDLVIPVDGHVHVFGPTPTLIDEKSVVLHVKPKDD
jgi:hypothetical protein